MALKTQVKVSSITNLSDARYCAGMDVAMLGFQVSEGTKEYMSPAQFQEIRGWFAGPAVVAEVADTTTVDFAALKENYSPDYIEVAYAHLQHYAQADVPLIVRMSREALTTAATLPNNVRYVIIDYADLNHLPAALSVPVLVKLHDTLPEGLLHHDRVHGIVLQGGDEVRPGLKSYDDLAAILEALETED